MGKLIVIDGVDGSGKSTQLSLLHDEFASYGYNMRKLSFPCYDLPSGALAKFYLEGGLGGAEDVNAYAASVTYAIDRYFSYKTDWKEFFEKPDSVILTSRYTTSNAVHQLAKLPREEWDGFLLWLEDLEYVRLGIPRPDGVIFLEMKPEISFSLVKQRCEREGVKRDIHETDLELVRSFSRAGQYSAAKSGWIRIQCDNGGAPLPVESIHSEIVAAATKIITKNG